MNTNISFGTYHEPVLTHIERHCNGLFLSDWDQNKIIENTKKAFMVMVTSTFLHCQCHLDDKIFTVGIYVRNIH